MIDNILYPISDRIDTKYNTIIEYCTMKLSDGLSIVLLIQEELVGQILWDYLEVPESIISNFDISIRSGGSIQKLAIYYHFGKEDQKKLVYGYLTEDGTAVRLLWHNNIYKDTLIHTLKEFKEYFRTNITTDLIIKSPANSVQTSLDDFNTKNNLLKELVKVTEEENNNLKTDLIMLQDEHNALIQKYRTQSEEINNLILKNENLNNELISLMIIIQEQESIISSMDKNKKFKKIDNTSKPITITETKLEMPEEA